MCVWVLIDVVGGEFEKLHSKCIGATTTTAVVVVVVGVVVVRHSEKLIWKILCKIAFFILQLHWFSIPKVWSSLSFSGLFHARGRKH